MRLRQLLPLLFCWLYSLAAPAQRRALHHQISLQSENDNYTIAYTDRYYTNGMMLRYVHAPRPEQGKRQKLLTVELGHQIFTPIQFSPGYRRFMDRPFTGLAYLKVLQTRFYSGGALLQWGGMAAVVGEKAFGREVQRWHHRNFGLKFPYGWETELKTGVGFNAEGRYVHPLLRQGGTYGFSLMASTQAQVGNLFVQGGAGLLLRAGVQRTAASSAAFDATLFSEQRKAEWFFYYEPQLLAQAYNATLQGTLWQHLRNVYTTTPKPLVCRQQAGLVYARRCWTAHVYFAHKSKEATTMRARENWGGVGFGFRW